MIKIENDKNFVCRDVDGDFFLPRSKFTKKKYHSTENLRVTTIKIENDKNFACRDFDGDFFYLEANLPEKNIIRPKIFA